MGKDAGPGAFLFFSLRARFLIALREGPLGVGFEIPVRAVDSIRNFC